jgi:hypothetical protein
MDDKDRFGDKLHDKEKADENRFIAERERLALEKLRQQQAVTAVRGLCPRDGTKLVTRKEHGVEVDTCPACRGLWIDKGELEAMVSHAGEPWISRWIRSILEG